MLNIIRRKLQEQFRGVSIYSIFLILFGWMYVALFPSMQKIDIEAMMAQMPKEFLGFLGDGGASAYNTIEGFMSGEYYSFFFVLLLAFYVANTAGSAIAGNIEKRTIDFNLSQPISRTKMLLAETFVVMFYSAAIVSVVNLMIKLLSEVHKVSISSKGLLMFCLVAIVFAWAIYGVAIFLSSILKSKIAVVGITIFFTLGSYLFYSLSLAVDKIKDLGTYSIYNFYSPQKLLSKGEIDPTDIIVLGSIFLIGLLLSLFIFNKKDV